VLAQLAGGEVPAEALGRLPAEARHLPRSGPDDLVVLYAAGHGYTDPADGMFYMLPYDVGDHARDLSGDAKARQAAFRAIFERSVSSSELSRWLRGVDAAQHVLVLDTCMSQGAVASAASEFKPGPFGSRGLGQLAYDKAMLVLAASQTDEFAVGLGRLKHGLLTYTLLEGLEPAGAGRPPRAAGEGGRLTLSGLLRYAADRAPEVYSAARAGTLEARGLAVPSKSPGGPGAAVSAEPWAPGRWRAWSGGGRAWALAAGRGPSSPSSSTTAAAGPTSNSAERGRRREQSATMMVVADGKSANTIIEVVAWGKCC
jgi:hypothetical protein